MARLRLHHRSNDRPRRLRSLPPHEPAPVRIQPRQKSPLETGTHQILLTSHSTIVALSRKCLVINSVFVPGTGASQLPTPNSFVGGTRYCEFPHEIVRPFSERPTRTLNVGQSWRTTTQIDRHAANPRNDSDYLVSSSRPGEVATVMSLRSDYQSRITSHPFDALRLRRAGLSPFTFHLSPIPQPLTSHQPVRHSLGDVGSRPRQRPSRALQGSLPCILTGRFAFVVWHFVLPPSREAMAGRLSSSSKAVVSSKDWLNSGKAPSSNCTLAKPQAPPTIAGALMSRDQMRRQAFKGSSRQ
jgi:hypothetical protein